jgi:hypothetical protein
VKLLDNAAETRIGCSGLVSVIGIYKLVAVHCHPAVGTDQLFLGLSHRVLASFLQLVYRYPLTTGRNVLAIQTSSFRNLSMRRM